MTNIFVYGSLKRNFRNHPLLAGTTFLGRAVTTTPNYIMSSAGGFPVAHYAPKTKWGYICGEVYEVNQDTLLRVDSLEGHPNWYRRHTVSVVTDSGVIENAIMYVQDLNPYDVQKREELSWDPMYYRIDVDPQGNQSWEPRATMN